MSLLLCVTVLFVGITYSTTPSVPLYNAAVPNTLMPMVGLGTGSYCGKGKGNNSSYRPLCLNDTSAAQMTIDWFNVGGRRIDNAITYTAWQGIANGILQATNNWTTTQRSEIFITSKTGPPFPLGYNDSINQWQEIINTFNTKYIDLLLIHWPSDNSSHSFKSSDPFCNANNTLYSASKCRQSTWKAYEYIFNNGGAKAIGVSNFESNHLQDIISLNSLLPSVNQIEFHGYWHEYNLVEYCENINITFNSYAPLGAPDEEKYNWNPLLTQHPIAMNIGEKYNKSAAQIWLRWNVQQNIVFNPLTVSIQHMKENLNVFDFVLNEEEMLQLSNVTDVPKDPKVCGNPQKAA